MTYICGNIVDAFAIIHYSSNSKFHINISVEFCLNTTGNNFVFLKGNILINEIIIHMLNYGHLC